MKKRIVSRSTSGKDCVASSSARVIVEADRSLSRPTNKLVVAWGHFVVTRWWTAQMTAANVYWSIPTQGKGNL